MQFIINPYEGVGEICFGMEQSKIRTILGENYESFKRNESDSYPCNYFESYSCFIYYKTPGVVEAMEFNQPAELFFDDVNLFDLTYSELKALLLMKDKNLEVEEDNSLTSYFLGIGVYAPYVDENPNLPVESIIVFEKNYYDL